MLYYNYPNWRYLTGKAKSRALRSLAEGMRTERRLAMASVEMRKQSERMKGRLSTIWKQRKYYPTPHYLRAAFDWRFRRPSYPTEFSGIF